MYVLHGESISHRGVSVKPCFDLPYLPLFTRIFSRNWFSSKESTGVWRPMGPVSRGVPPIGQHREGGGGFPNRGRGARSVFPNGGRVFHVEHRRPSHYRAVMRRGHKTIDRGRPVCYNSVSGRGMAPGTNRGRRHDQHRRDHRSRHQRLRRSRRRWPIARHVRPISRLFRISRGSTIDQARHRHTGGSNISANRRPISRGL